jgi:dCTP deaminase
MSVLSAKELVDRIYRVSPHDAGRIFIVPTPPRDSIKDTSVDLMLGNRFIVTKTAKFSVLDACGEATERDIASYQERVLLHFGNQIVLHPGTFILGVTWQYIGLPSDIQGQVLARSTWGRAGLAVATAVVVHPSFSGCLTLELVNNGNAPIALYPGSRIAQITFMHCEPGSVNVAEASKYSGMIEPGFTRLHEERSELCKWQEIGRRVSFQTG